MIETSSQPLPQDLKRLFWDVEFRRLRWERDSDFIIGRVLAEGGLEHIRWLMKTAGDGTIRDWITRRRGARVGPPHAPLLGARKDFVDIHALGTHHRPLAEMLRLYQTKYGIPDVAHVLRSLIYFDDADREPTPRLLRKVDWRTLKSVIRDWVQEAARP